MNTQASMSQIERLEAGQARHLGRLGGEMTVLSGRIWLTRDGETGDHFLDAGDTVRIAVDDYAVIQSADRDSAASLLWTARRQTVAGRIFAEPLLGLALSPPSLPVGWVRWRDRCPKLRSGLRDASIARLRLAARNGADR